MAADDKRGGGLYDVEPRRSIFAALWFRVILVLIVVGVIGALAVPYVLDVVNPPGVKPAVVPKPAAPAVATPAPPPALAPAPAQAPAPAEPPAPKPPAVAPVPTPAPAAQPATTEEKQAERPTTTKPAKQTARGLPTEPGRGGGVVRPGLPLRDAVALSKDLAAMGLKVQVRRSGAAASPASTPAANPGGDGLHRVRVGPYPDRAAATSALKELEAKGYKPFLARR